MLTVASQSVTHDAKGNMTLIPAVLRPTNSGLPPTASRLSWDFENKLIAADTDTDSVDDIFYKFDALGRRVGRDDGTANVVYFQDGQQTIANYPSGTAAGSPTYTYVYASYIDEPVMRGGSGGLRYYHRNQQYSITAVSDGGGSVVERYAYSAYGQVTFADVSGSQISNSAISNRYAYTGREWDEGLSLYHYRARMYDAVGGRFVSRDPIGFGGSPFNLYEYVKSNPGTHGDPSGLAMPRTGTSCCGKEKIVNYTHGCCKGKPFHLDTECCENNSVVSKVPIWKCKRYANMGIPGYPRTPSVLPNGLPLTGHYPIIGIGPGILIWHHYLCCDGPNGSECRGMIPGAEAGKDVPFETQKSGKCRERLVCPSVHTEKCDSPKAPCDYGALGCNCWSWANI
jgi:RHS repeat-associated protein